MNVKMSMTAMRTAPVATHMAPTSAIVIVVSMETDFTAQMWTSATPPAALVMNMPTVRTRLVRISVNAFEGTTEMD